MIGPAELRIDEEDGVVVARLVGEVDLSNASEVGARLTESVVNWALGVVLDLSETRYLDSSGVQLVFELAERLTSRGQRLCLCVPEDAPVRRVLTVVDVESAVPIAATLEDARATVQGAA
jgi:anti-anti-sigma factor